MNLKWLMAFSLFWGSMAVSRADDALFYQQSPLPDSITLVTYKGEIFQQFLVRKNDPPQPQWGDGANNQLRKRAQVVANRRTPLGEIKRLKFRFAIPGDWKLSEYPFVLTSGHTVNLVIGPWGLNVNRDKLEFIISIDNPNGKPPTPDGKIVEAYNAKIPFKLDEVYDFELEMKVSKDMSGYARAYLNGKQFVDYSGPTVSFNESGLPYDKFGPYVFSKNEQWPHPRTDHLRVLMQIPQSLEE